MRGHTIRWCSSCNRRDALHIDGVCTMAHTHLHPCETCGERPVTPSARWCSECQESHAIGDAMERAQVEREWSEVSG